MVILLAFGDPFGGTKETVWKKFLWTLQKLLSGLRRFRREMVILKIRLREFLRQNPTKTFWDS